jgi:fatty acid-binding protein DegV
VSVRVHKDWQELTPDALYQAMRAGAEPVTEPPSVEDFAEVYERYLQVYDRLLSLHVSGELSKTVERAREAALKVAPTRIRVVDSGMVSAGLGAMVLRAVEMLNKKSFRSLPSSKSTRLAKRLSEGPRL